MKLRPNKQWMNAWTAALDNRFARLTARETARIRERYTLSGDALMRQHQAYMTATQQGYDAHNQQFEAGQFQKQYQSDNEVDYILDCTRSRTANGNIISAGVNCPNRQTPP